mgnify:CR=1 FL=1
MSLRHLLIVACVTLGSFEAAATPATAQTTDTIQVRGHKLTVRLYGKRGAPPVVVSSGDGGWVHLGPHVAETLAAHGCFVVGVDAKAYLESFTSGSRTLTAQEEPGDYRLFQDAGLAALGLVTADGVIVHPKVRELLANSATSGT